MTMIELERTFLLKELPKKFDEFAAKEIIDLYIPKISRHPNLRIRKNGNIYTITKKTPKNNDTSEFIEETLNLTKDEFEGLKAAENKIVRKFRYRRQQNNIIIEIDIFKDELKGLALVDFEFQTVQEKNNFKPFDFCGAEVTHEEVIAGGYLAGKSYKDIEEILGKKYNYKSLIIAN